MHASQPAHRPASRWLVAILGSLALLLSALLLAPAVSHAEESNPNNYECQGAIAKGEPEEGVEEELVKYEFFCDGPITGYQVQAQVPMTYVASPPLVSELASVASPTKENLFGITPGKATSDSFSCSGDVPGIAANCVGAATKGSYDVIAGQFAIEKKICVEPRVDPLLTVTYAYLEKGVITQAIAGPFDLGRPKGCPPDAYSGSTRLEPHPPIVLHKKKPVKKKKAAAKKAVAKK